jgi:hypothetical protein
MANTIHPGINALYSWRISIAKYEKPLTTTRVVTLVTLEGLLQVQEDWEEHLTRKSSSCTPSLKDTLAGDDDEQSICRQLNAHTASDRPRDSGPKGDGRCRCSIFISLTDKSNP